MGCNRCRRDSMHDPRFGNDRYDGWDRDMRRRRRRDFFDTDDFRRRREFFDTDDFRRRRDFFDTDEFRRRRRRRAVIIGFPRFF